MKVYDFFAGTRSATLPFENAGHDVFSIDNDEQFDVSLHADFLKLNPRTLPWKRPDLIWASPPCTSFSMGSNRHHWKATADCLNCGYRIVRVSGEKWEHEHYYGQQTCGEPHTRYKADLEPKSPTGELGLALLKKTLEVIEYLQPKFFVIENPTALMRSLPLMQSLEMRPTSYCVWGKSYRKPTDLWGRFPDTLAIKPPCKAVGGKSVLHRGKIYRVDRVTGKPCHEAASRGARTGTQGLSAVEAGMIPYKLAKAVYLAVERDAA